jgi:hypothetical protein
MNVFAPVCVGRGLSLITFLAGSICCSALTSCAFASSIGPVNLRIASSCSGSMLSVRGVITASLAARFEFRTTRAAFSSSVISANGTSNGGLDSSDYVGVVTACLLPDALNGVTASDLRRIQTRVGQGRWRENIQAKDWVGIAVAEVLGLELKTDRRRIAVMLKVWIKNGAFIVVQERDRKGTRRPCVVVGTLADRPQRNP